MERISFSLKGQDNYFVKFELNTIGILLINVVDIEGFTSEYHTPIIIDNVDNFINQLQAIKQVIKNGN